MSLSDPRPGDLWFKQVRHLADLGETEVFVLVTESAVYTLGLSVPVFPVLISSHRRDMEGVVRETRPPRPAQLYPFDFEGLELLSRSDKESEESEESGEEEMTCP